MGAGASVSKRKQLSVYKAALAGDADALNKALASGKNHPQMTVFQDPENFHETPLHAACKVNSPECVTLLLDAKADALYKNKKGNTPLHTAARNDAHLSAKALMSHLSTKDVDARNLEGLTPLLEGVAYAGCTRSTHVLLDHGADMEAVDFKGQTAVHWAAMSAAMSALMFLADRGAALNVQDQDGYTPLHHAVTCGHEEIVEYLIGKGASPVSYDGCRWVLVVMPDTQWRDTSHVAVSLPVPARNRSLHAPFSCTLAAVPGDEGRCNGVRAGEDREPRRHC